MKHRVITPLLVGEGSTASTTLERVRLGQGVHDEKWLQALIQKHPEVLPVAQIVNRRRSLTPSF
jgi:hypothetical protein